MSGSTQAGHAVSVVIPVYNRHDLVRRAVDSVLSQLGGGDEIVVVDDGSTDGTLDAVRGYPEQVRVIAAEHGGVAKARNRGVSEARNGIVAFLDSDDTWVAGKLDMQRRVMAARPDVVISSTDFLAVGPGFETRFGLSEWLRGYPEIQEALTEHVAAAELTGELDLPECTVMFGDFYPMLLQAPCVLTSTVMMRRELAEFPEDQPMFEDWECFAQAAAAGTWAHLHWEGSAFHQHTGQRLTDADPSKSLICRLTMVERVWGLDARFLSVNRSMYDATLADLQRALLYERLAAGDSGQARELVARLGSAAPVMYRALAGLPRRGLATALGARRLLKRLLRPVSGQS